MRNKTDYFRDGTKPLHFTWTVESINLLKALADQGLYADDIAKKMALELGHPFTKNAIIGKTHRLGVKLKHTRWKPKKPKDTGVSGNPQAVPVLPIIEP